MILTGRSAAMAAAVAVFFAVGPLSAQDKEKESDGEDFRLDPYTKHEAAALAKAGYVALNEFKFADDLTTQDIEKTLGDGVELIWVETAHFRIGSSLPEYEIVEREEKDRFKAEFERLRARIPAIPAKVPRKLDSWLRLHLTAQRCEELYAEFVGLFALDQVRWPTGPGQTVDGKYLGEGPYLGMTDKFTVILFEKESSYGRLRERYLAGGGGTSSARHLFIKSGSMLFAAHVQGSNLDEDTVLHCSLAYNLMFNLLDGTKYYTHAAPTWLPVGLGHVFARRISPKFNYFTDDRSYSSDDKDQWDWPPRVQARVKNQVWPSAAKIFALPDVTKVEYVDHMMAWSRMDFLISERTPEMPILLDGVKGRLVTGRTPTAEEIATAHAAAFQKAFGMDAAGFDAAWSAWVLKTYPKK
jgi:hypothetical protein